MIAVDTNVLVRILVNDPDASLQMQAARALLVNSSVLFVPQIVQVETVWVLESAYGFEKPSICKILDHLLHHPQFQLQSAESFTTAVTLFRKHSADFSDCLILTEATARQLQLYTFDKKLGRIKGTATL
ncbi:MAG: type II toxin-antitoxin system VapC family toxin [Deltaproteobacteria bacterium]|nr:type II toxin-antitoxin system VapC family toxin [Deltaproteobacteria bacterium]